MNRTIIIVDDDWQTAKLLQTAMEIINFPTRVFLGGHDFLNHSVGANDIILLDLIMPDIDGVEVIRSLATRACQAKLILMSGYDKTVLLAAERLANEYSLEVSASITKPIGIKRLQELIQQLARQYPVVSKLPDKNGGDDSFPNEDISLTRIELVKAIENKELVLYFQPQVTLRDKALVGLEALVRWNHPRLGVLPPILFLPWIFKHGLSDELNREVITQALKIAGEWQQQEFNQHISINVSPPSITSLSMPEQLVQLTEENLLTPSAITMEVTEHALMTKLQASLDILTRLRIKGFGLSIDDFGTGYSSLAQLHRVPFNELKIDRGFVTGMEDNEESRSIVKTCIMLGHELGMKIVAEGVESAGEEKLLTELGCDIAQGYHFAHPMPSEQVMLWATQNFPEKLSSTAS